MDIIIDINNGKIKGYEEDDVKIFKGIPYAEAPIGDLRLNNPIPKNPWNGILDASNYRAVAPQPPPITSYFPPPPQSEEECLNLNVWTPGCDENKRPVMFWIHGGSHIFGSGILLNGRNISRRGDIVLVSINYRLGPLGNFYIPGAPQNINQLDQITALEWVRDNIAYFGGDPNNVTIFGESAGATSVCALLAMPKAKGLFTRAVSQSSAVTPRGFDLSVRKKTAEMLMNELNLKVDDLDGYRTLQIETIINAFVKVQIKAFQNQIELDFRPHVDNDSLPQHPIKAIQEGYAKDIELIVGTNLEEWRFWRAFEPKFEEVEPARIENRIKILLKNLGENENKLQTFIETYQKSREEYNLAINIHEIYEAYLTDSIFRIPSLKVAEAQSKHQKNTYMYMFKWKTPFENNRYGAMHAMEIAFVFGSFWEDYLFTFPKKTVETESLSNNMMNAWVLFAKTGNPNHDGIPNWPTYDIEKRSTIIFDNEIVTWDDPLKKEREMWFNTNIWSQF
ncbi:MAG: carboxylesterase/lipase family protein [Candidatus Hodarchaeales archaeon]|jgi:para-nitrobenzyl esterase